MTDNPFLIVCPCCGAPVCARCASLDARQAGLGDDADDDRERQRLAAVRRIHLETYPHEAPTPEDPES